MPLGFLDPNNTGVNYCPLRYADVLMAAEAYNETGNTPKAWELLNDVRERAKATKVNSLQEYKNVHKKLYDLPFFNMVVMLPTISVLHSIGNAVSNWLLKGSVNTICYVGAFWLRHCSWFQSKMDKSLKGKYVAGDNFVEGKHELFPIPIGRDTS